MSLYKLEKVKNYLSDLNSQLKDWKSTISTLKKDVYFL